MKKKRIWPALLLLLASIANALMDQIQFYWKTDNLFFSRNGWKRRYINNDPTNRMKKWYKWVFFWPCDLWHWLKYVVVFTMAVFLHFAWSMTGIMLLDVLIYVMIYGGIQELAIWIYKKTN